MPETLPRGPAVAGSGARATDAGPVLRVLAEDGTSDPATDPGLAPAALRKMLETMLLVRALDERGFLLQRQGRISFYGAALGQEAGPIGTAAALDDRDWIFPGLRESGAMLYRGHPVRDYVAQWYGNALDPLRGRQMPCHYADRRTGFVSWSSCIGTQIPQAAGAAMAMRRLGHPLVAAAFFGDGATSQGDFHVGLNFAGVFRAPVVFICQNNGWSISVPVERQTASPTLAGKAEAYGFGGRQVDGNDVLAVYAAVREAAERARSGGGPTLLELLTYRMGAHSTSDDPSRYRDENVTKQWGARDPVERFRRHLTLRGMWSAEEETAFRERTRAQIAAAVEEVERAGPPPLASLFEDVFASPTPELLRQGEECSTAASADPAPSKH